MASGGKRKGAGERVLEGRHVIGLFLLMLVFSGVFFTLGYVMGRSQYDGQVRAASRNSSETGTFKGDSSLSSKHSGANKTQTPAVDPSMDNSGPVSSDWEFYKAGEPNKTEDHLEHLTPAAPVPAVRR
jgi:hypothetical protein